MRALLRPPLRVPAILVAVAALVVGGIVWFFGVEPLPASLVSLAVFAVGVTWISVQEGDRAEWPRPVVRRTPGARRDLERLGWAMKSHGGIHEKTLSRVREAARHRLLFLYGLDLYDPDDRAQIEAILAPPVVRTLMTPRRSHLDLVSFTRLMNAVEALGRAPASGPAAAPSSAPDPGGAPASDPAPTERHP